MFSKAAKENGISLEEIEKLITFLQEDIDKLHDNCSPGQFEENNYGVKIINLSYVASISINDVIYKLDFGECVRYDVNEDNVGLTWLVVFPADSESFPDVPETGVYVIK